jgi:hypothetical protein
MCLSVQHFRVSGVEERKPEQLIIPGGESTTNAAVARSVVNDDRLGFGPDGSRSGLRKFLLFLKIDFWCWLT